MDPRDFTKVSALGVEEQRVNALIDIPSPAAPWSKLGDAFRLAVRILIPMEEGAVQVPVSALFPLGARSGLLVLDGGRARWQEVDVDARNGSSAWVKWELAAGTQMIDCPDSLLQDCERVRTR